MCIIIKRRAIRLLLLSIFMVNIAQAASIGTNPLNNPVSIGELFFVDVIGEAFPVTEGGGFNLAFDPLVLNVLSVSIDGSVWNFVNDLGTINNGAGTLSDVLVSAFPEVTTSNLIVATLELKAVGSGTSSLTLTESTINPWSSNGATINPGFTPGSVTVTSAVPVPATLWLFVSGFIGLLGIARKNTISNN